MPPKKRSLGEVQTPQSGSRRRSTRLESTGKKSSYFEQDDVDDSEDEASRPRKMTKTSAIASRPKSESRQNLSDDEDQYEEDDIDDGEDNEGSDAFDEEDDDSATPAPPPKSSTSKRGRGRPPKNAHSDPPAKKAKANPPSSKSKVGSTQKKGRQPANEEDDASPSAKRNGNAAHGSDKDEDDFNSDEVDEDGMPKAVFRPFPKLRDLNGVEYEDTTVHPNTLLFLGDLRANNNRKWLHSHDGEYRRSQKDWQSFVETLTDKIIEDDDTIPELPAKDVIFRIYRDIRFSKDPTPYKAHYSAAWSRTGRKGPYACYYVHIEPGHCMIGGGLWHPEASALAKLRASIDERPHRIRRVLTDPEFVRTFLPNAVGKKEDKVIKAFADKNKENALKTKPKGFNPEHRDIALLKLRNYTVGRKIADADLHGDDAQEKIMATVRAMVPFVTFLNSVVMPDPGVDSDSDEEENGNGDGDGDEDREDEDEDDEEEEDDEDEDEEGEEKADE
ncbi:hypothetical protein F4777DRAFT_563148 [Nemania sp. FL0916]|nr:hypothetical protein F4777DRAFT_563148 [Nemania sp. FL0916]